MSWFIAINESIMTIEFSVERKVLDLCYGVYYGGYFSFLVLSTKR